MHQPRDKSKARTTYLLASVWERNRPLMLSRLETLDEAARALEQNTLTPELLASAIDIAHKLAGSLGMFGIPAGTDHARALEQELERASPDPATVHTLTQSLRASMFSAE